MSLEFIIQIVKQLKSEFPSISDSYALHLIDNFVYENRRDPLGAARDYILQYQQSNQRKQDNLPEIVSNKEEETENSVQKLKKIFPMISEYYASQLIDHFTEINYINPFEEACNYIRQYQKQRGIEEKEEDISGFYF
jgi:hypothetical protein